MPKKSRPSAAADKANSVFQFKFTLKDTKPPIWRRIQTEDCTLDKFHEHIQTTMGWTSSHLHQFLIDNKRYGNPKLMDDGFDDSGCIDSTRTKLSQIIPADGKPIRILYEYDFGDS